MKLVISYDGSDTGVGLACLDYPGGGSALYGDLLSAVNRYLAETAAHRCLSFEDRRYAPSIEESFMNLPLKNFTFYYNGKLRAGMPEIDTLEDWFENHRV